MRLDVSLRSALLASLVSLLAAGSVSCLGCGGEPQPPELALLRAFPDQAAEVLEGSASFEASDEGFTRSTRFEAAQSALAIALPQDGEGVIRFHLHGGVEILVREVGVAGRGVLAGRAVSYRRSSGTSFWTAVSGGVEEWLHLDAGAVRVGEAAAVWEIEGASPRKVGGAVLLVDEAGAAQMLVTAPRAYGAGGRAIEAHLEVRGARMELSVDAGDEAVLVDPLWTATKGGLSTGRDLHGATLLQNGRVLVSGGDTLNGATDTVELYDPATNIWSGVKSMSTPREQHGLTLLADGTVLATGGDDGGALLQTVELYNPTTDTWALKAPMSGPRRLHSATLLRDGRHLLVAAGNSGLNTYVSTAEVYDPVTQMWTSTGLMNKAREAHTATLLQDDKVLVTGGDTGSNTFLASVELYDPATATWTTVAPMGTARTAHTATLLKSGKVLVAGGTGTSGQLASAEVYDPIAKTWSPGGSMSDARSLHTATLLDNGAVLVAGGFNGSALVTAELYDPTTNTWMKTVSMGGTPRLQHTATLLKSGKVLVAAGSDGFAYLSTSQIYSLDADGTSCSFSAAFLCQSGFCVDGVCCDSACASACSACSAAKKGAGAAGACGPIIAGLDPDNECADLGAASCQTTGSCDGAGACQKYPDQTPCDDGNTCTLKDVCLSGVCQSGAPVVCPEPPICQKSTCYPVIGACVIYNNDGADCPGGSCFAGGCLIPSSSASGSAGASGSSSASASGSGSGAGGADSTGSGEPMASSSASGSGAGGAAANAGASGSGASGSRGVLRLHGGGCGISRAPASAAPWLLLGLLLAAGRRSAHPKRRDLIPRNRRDPSW